MLVSRQSVEAVYGLYLLPVRQRRGNEKKKKRNLAHMKMMSSTAFPNVTFIKAPTVSPIRLAMLSVAWLRSPASGTMASAFIANTTPAGA